MRAPRIPVEIQSVSYTTDANGTKTATWTTFATYYAEITQLAGASVNVGDKAYNHRGSHKLKGLYRSDITTFHRIKWGSRILKIDSVSDAPSSMQKLEILATEYT